MRLGLVAMLAAVATVARAHALETATARISLRDGQVEVAAEWDVLVALDDGPTAVAIASDAELGDAHARLVRRLESESRLALDGVQASLRARGFPSAEELRALAAAASAAGDVHGPVVRFFLDARVAGSAPSSVSFRAPAVLGPVLVSFVQPAASYALPGATSSFTVLAAPRDLDMAGIGVGFACGAVVARLVSRRRLK